MYGVEVQGIHCIICDTCLHYYYVLYALSIFCCSQLVFTEAEKNENFNTKIIRHISFLVARRFRFARSSDIYNLFDIPALTGPKAAGLATSNMYHVV